MSLEAQLLDPRTSLHGVPESCHNYGNLTAKANMASECMVEDVLSKQLYDQGQELWAPMEYISLVYDVGTHGGTVTSHTLDVEVPIGTIIVGGIFVIADKFVAASGTPTLTINITSDVLSNLDVCAENVNAMVATVPLFANAATWVVVDSETITVTVGSTALTAGRLYGYLMCFRNVIGNERSSASSASSASSSSSSSSSPSSNSSSSSSSSDRLRF